MNSFFAWTRSIARPAIAAVLIVCGWSTAWCAEHVIHISVDGLNPEVLQSLIDAGQAPNFKRLEDEGAWTLNARTDYTHTITLPNHTSMLTARPVLVPEGIADSACHNWVENAVPKVGASLHKSEYVPSVFDVAHDAGLSSALYASKEKFVLYDLSYNENSGAPHARGRDKIDTYVYHDDGPPRFSQTLNEHFLRDLAERKYRYAFVHYRDPDAVGHDFRFGGSIYRQAIRGVDGYLGEVLKLVESDAAFKGRTVLIVGTDHGGAGFGHSDARKVENYTIPIFVWGAGVSRGDLYAFNRQTRADPGTERVDYACEKQPIRNGDTGNLALSLLGLGPIPTSMINARQDLRVSLAGDYNGDGSVDAADYVVWKGTDGSTTDLRADGNGDGRVDEADHTVWKSHMGDTTAAPE